MNPPSSILRRVLQLLTVCLLALVGPALLWRQFEAPEQVMVSEFRNSEFSPVEEVAKLAQGQPAWVLVGNSMLNTRLDSKALAALSGVKTKKVAKGGSQSALWFLFIKKIIVESGAHPRVVTVFFRDTDLTWPELRLGGMNEPLVKELHGHEQPEWAQVFPAEMSEAGLLGWAKGLVAPYLPPDEMQATMRRQIQNRSFRATRIHTEITSGMRRMELNHRFSLEHLRRDLGSDFGTQGSAAASPDTASDPGVYEDGPMTFDPSPDASFLPHMLALAKAQGFVLHLHRVKRKPEEDHTRRDLPAVNTYMRDLRAYLEANGCIMTDETQDPSLTLDMYVDGDHISSQPEMQQRYLENFWQRVSPIVSPLLTAPATPDHGLPKR